jgi:hypothetical protein
MRLLLIFMMFLGLAIPILGAAQEIKNWGIDAGAFHRWMSSKCAEKSDLSGGFSSLRNAKDELGALNRDKCFNVLQFTILARQLLFENGLQKNDRGILKFAPNSKYIEICDYQISPDADKIPSEIEDLVIKGLGQDADSRKEILDPKYKTILEKIIKIKCTTYSS